MMKYASIEGIPAKLSRLVYGTTGAAYSGDRGRAFECLDAAWEAGFRTFDTAHSYGKAEEVMGEWMASRGVRDELVLLDKGCNPGQKDLAEPEVFSAETIREQVKCSRERLQTDVLDLYILHRDDPSVPVDEIVEVLNELHADGVIRVFGGSNWSFDRIKQFNAYAEAHELAGIGAISPCYSLAVLKRDPWGGSVTISGEENAEFRAFLEKTQLPVLNYSSLGRGYLSGKYNPDDPMKSVASSIGTGPIAEYYSADNDERLRRAFRLAKEKGCTVSQLCLAWLFAQPLNLFPLTAPGSAAHIAKAVASFDVELTKEEAEQLLNVER